MMLPFWVCLHCCRIKENLNFLMRTENCLFVCLPGYGIGWVLLLLHGIQIVEHFDERMRIGKHGADYFE